MFLFHLFFVNPPFFGVVHHKKRYESAKKLLYIPKGSVNKNVIKFPKLGHFRPVQSSSGFFVVFLCCNWGKSWVKVIRSLRLERCHWSDVFCFAWLEIGFFCFFYMDRIGFFWSWPNAIEKKLFFLFGFRNCSAVYRRKSRKASCLNSI